MFNLIIQNFHKRLCKRKPEQVSQSNVPLPSREKVIVEIDYNKLADALLKTEEKIRQEKEKQSKIEYQKRQLAWEKALKCQRHNNNNVIIRILLSISFPFRLLWGIITFNKKHATTNNATYSLLKICNHCIFLLYRLILLCISLGCGIIIVDKLCPWISINTQISNSNITYFVVGFFCFIFERIIRIAQLETNNTLEKNTIVTVFNALVAFTGMIFAIIAVIVAITIKR